MHLCKQQVHPLKEYQNITLTVDRLNECDCDVHKKVGVEQLYNSVKTGSQLVWRPDQLEKDAVEKTSTQRGWVLRPPVEQIRRTRKKR